MGCLTIPQVIKVLKSRGNVLFKDYVPRVIEQRKKLGNTGISNMATHDFL